MRKNFQLLERKLLGSGTFIKVEQLDFIDRRGIKRRWESAGRVNSNGAAIIIAEIVPDEKLILVKQFRPPAWREVIEFPAGLIDAGESAAESAVRELREETGFEGEVKHVFDDVISAPGMSSEKLTVVMIKVDGAKYQNGLPASCQDESEDIETIVIHKDELFDFLKKSSNAGIAIDAKLLHYAMAMKFSR
ncbi:MAG: NUDIX hydrolase [Victivallaceae bacterium]|nr:NUDIX hydrolase [Victivallaceae bacterium]